MGEIHINNPMVVMPFIGEFGSLLIKHIPGCYGQLQEHIMCHEEGYEALYPNPNIVERYTFQRPDENKRGAAGHKEQDQIFQAIRDHYGTDYCYVHDTMPFKWPGQYFIPEYSGDYSHVPEFDIALFTRSKAYTKGRNWPYWHELHSLLIDAGIRCMVVGQPDSCEMLDCPGIWDYIDNTSLVLDASIWAIKKAKLRVGTATGTTFLSMLCAKPCMVIIGDNGLECIGSKRGVNASSYYKIDHQNVGWRIIAHWAQYKKVAREILEAYDDVEKFNRQCSDWVFGEIRDEDQR